MKRKSISPKDALELIKNNKYNNDYTVEFSDEKIDAYDAILLGEKNVIVPEDLIFYDDDNIDFSDIPEITDEDIESKKLIPVIYLEIPIDNEIQE